MSPSIPLSEKLDLLPALFTVGLSVVFHAISAPFRGSDGAMTFGRHVQNGVTRKLVGRMSIPQLQYISGTSNATFDKWASQHQSIETSTDDIGEGAKLHWIGNKKSEKVMFHLHGGGYILPLSAGLLQLLEYFRGTVHTSTGIEVAIAVLEYTRAPPATYPTQLRQANAGLHYIIKSGISPGNVLLTADSAGAHIALCLVSHILHPHPSVDIPPILSAPLAGLLMISPRVTNATSAGSFAANSNRDVLSNESYVEWINVFRAGSTIATEQGLANDGSYTEPLNAPDDWWTGLDKLIRSVFVSAGEHECMRDTIVEFAEKWKKFEGLDVTFVLEKQGIHASPLMDVSRLPSDLIQAVGHWLSAVVDARSS